MSTPLTNLRDYLKPYLRLLGAWNRRHLLRCAQGLLQGRTSVLSQAGRRVLTCQRKNRTIWSSRLDEWVKTMARFLRMLPWDAMEVRHFLRLKQRQGAWRLVIHDTSDIAKPWARKMEGLSTVRDGSTGALVHGYTLTLSLGYTGEGWGIDPITLTVNNPHDEHFRSEGAGAKEQIDRILQWDLGGDALHVFDRGFDDEKWFSFLDAKQVGWMIRLRGNRRVLFRGEEHPLDVVAATMLSERPTVRGGVTYTKTDIGITINHDGASKKITPEVRTYALVAIRRPQYARPMLLLLNARVTDTKQAVRRYRQYLDRWEIESYLKWIKEILKVEGVRLMTFPKIHNLLRLQLLMSDFILQEYRKGRLPLGGGIFEALALQWNPRRKDTRRASPYLFAEQLSAALQREHDYGYQGRRFGQARVASPLQLSLFPRLSDTG